MKSSKRLLRNSRTGYAGILSAFAWRRICDLDSRGLGKLFMYLTNQLKQNNYVDSLKKAFLGLKDNNRFPSDEEFSNALMSRDIYRQRRCNYILGQLANFESKDNDKINPKDFTIEHIMPQDVNLSPEWQNELGSNWATFSEYIYTRSGIWRSQNIIPKWATNLSLKREICRAVLFRAAQD